MTAPTDLARLVALVADDLDRRGYLAAGVVQQAAQVLADLPVDRPDSRVLDQLIQNTRTCPNCGAELPAPGRGRPRRWCSDECRRAGQRRNARNGLLDL